MTTPRTWAKNDLVTHDLLNTEVRDRFIGLDTSVGGFVGTPGSATDQALRGIYIASWKASTFYLAGQAAISPSGDVVTAKVNFTSGSTFNISNWNLSTTFAPASGSAFYAPATGSSVYETQTHASSTYQTSAGLDSAAATLVNTGGSATRVATDALYALPASPAAYNIPMRNAANTGLAWTTSHASVARALGWFIVTDPTYGAKGDVQGMGSVAITAGQTLLTRNNGPVNFTINDVGKKIAVAGAGTAGAALITTIASFVDATHVNLTAPAVTGVVANNGIYGTDDSVAIQAAMTAAKNAHGGVVYFPASGYFAAGLVLSTGTVLTGTGPGGDLFSTGETPLFKGTWLMTTPGANTDLVVTENFATLTGGTGTAGAPQKFGFNNLTLDGLLLNGYNTSGYVARIFGSSYSVSNCYFQYGASGGVWTEWGTGGYDMECMWNGFWFKNNGGHSLHVKGPHDGQFSNGIVSGGGAGQYGVWVDGGQAAGAQFSKVHVYGSFDWGWRVTAGSSYVDIKGEGATVGQFYLGAGDVHVKGEFFNGATAIGIQIGDTAAFPSYCTLDLKITGCQTPINVVTDSGYNTVRADINVLSGGAPVTGSWLSSSMVQIVCDKSVGSQDHGGSWQIPADVTTIKTHANALRVRNDANATVANVDTTDGATVTLKVQSPTTTTGTPDIVEFLDKNGVQQFAVSTGGPVVVGNNTSSHMRNTAGRVMFDMRDRTSGVNYFELGNNATGSGPTLSALGTDTNVDVVLVPKGTGSVRNGSATGPGWFTGTGSPLGVVAAPVGSLYTRKDGGAATTLYVKESATDATGWVAK